MRVEQTAEPGPDWDAFVEATAGAVLGHASAWARVLRSAYGLEPTYLLARDAAGQIAGVLPLVCFRTIAGRRELISLPFLDTAGILARDDDAGAALRDAALGLARERRACALELRQAAPSPVLPEPPAQARVDLLLALEADEDAQWKALRAKVRNQTRKAEREGLSIASAAPAELRRDFYGVFVSNMRDLGSPAHAEAFFAAAEHAFGERLRFVVARSGTKPVGGLVAIEYAGIVTVPWASTLRAERARCPNNAIYWEALRWAIRIGARAFDFGRSPPESGTHRFKRGWGAEEVALAWMRLGPGGAPLAADAEGPGAALRALSRLWTRMPLPLAAHLGPRLRRYLAN